MKDRYDSEGGVWNRWIYNDTNSYMSYYEKKYYIFAPKIIWKQNSRDIYYQFWFIMY